MWIKNKGSWTPAVAHRLSCHLQWQHVSASPLQIRLPAQGLGKLWDTVRVSGLLPPAGELWRSSWLLVWPHSVPSVVAFREWTRSWGMLPLPLHLFPSPLSPSSRSACFLFPFHSSLYFSLELCLSNQYVYFWKRKENGSCKLFSKDGKNQWSSWGADASSILLIDEAIFRKSKIMMCQYHPWPMTTWLYACMLMFYNVYIYVFDTCISKGLTRRILEFIWKQ